VITDRFGLLQQLLPFRQNPLRAKTSPHPHFCPRAL